MGFPFTPTASLADVGATAYFADYAAQRKAYLAERRDLVVTVDEDGMEQVVERPESASKERTVTLVQGKTRIGDDELGRSPKAVYKAALALGWELRCWLVIADFAPVLYVSDSAEDNAASYSAGDVRYEGYRARLYTIEGRHPDLPLGFRARYLGKDEGTSASWENALVRDPEGIEVPNWADYTKDKTTAKELGWTEEMRIQMGMAMNARINDGTTRREQVYLFRQARPFQAWLNSKATNPLNGDQG